MKCDWTCVPVYYFILSNNIHILPEKQGHFFGSEDILAGPYNVIGQFES